MLAAIFKILGTVATAVGLIKQFGLTVGVNTPQVTNIENEVINVIDATQADHSNYESGQAVIVATFTESGVKGYLVAVKSGGPAAGSLGL